MAISEKKMQMVIANYFKDECDVNTSIKQAFEKGFRIGVKKGASMNRPQGEWIVYEGGWKDLDYYPPKCKCNQCGYEEELYILNAKPTNFCSNCGAKMKGANNDL